MKTTHSRVSLAETHWFIKSVRGPAATEKLILGATTWGFRREGGRKQCQIHQATSLSLS